MLNDLEFKELINKRVDRLFFRVWPPWGEEKHSNIDISFGFVFSDNQDELFIISVDKDEIWAHYITIELLPITRYSWEDYYGRMKEWMLAKEDTELLFMGYEYFEKIIGDEILKIELLRIEDVMEPFGVKLYFKNDYIISFPNSDGNTIGTKLFNKDLEGIEHFHRLGKIIFIDA
jgi:hypothetical protein